MIGSNPPQGNNVAANTLVTLYASTGAAPVAVPSVVGQQESTAAATLQQKGFNVTVKSDPTSTQPSGTVVQPEPERRHRPTGLHGDDHRFRRRRAGALGDRRFAADRQPDPDHGRRSPSASSRAAARPSTATAPCSRSSRPRPARRPRDRRSPSSSRTEHLHLRLRPPRRPAARRRPRVRLRLRAIAAGSAPSCDPSGYAWVPHCRASPGHPRTPHGLVSRRPPCPSHASARRRSTRPRRRSRRGEGQPAVDGPGHRGLPGHRPGLDRGVLRDAGLVPGMSALGSWNLVVGFAFIIGGVTLATRWR